jgi:hypothetical protein
MRFKTIYLIFNIVIVFSFLFIFFMPLLLLGGEHFGEFLTRNWPSGALFVVALAGFNAYFIRSWKLFALLEREDWNGLIGYLEQEVYSRGRITRRHVKILINAYLVASRMEEIIRLRERLTERRPALTIVFAIPFGIPYLLLNRPADSERYFAGVLAKARPRDRSWVSWNHAFSLVQLRELEAARREFESLLADHRDPVLYLLSLYMLDSLSRGDERQRAAVRARALEFRSRHTRKAWARRVEGARDNMEVLVLFRIIKQASDWVFDSADSAGAASPPAAPDRPGAGGDATQ